MSQILKSYDMVVIGSGPAGYVCALRAAQLGMKILCVERMDAPGGTCLNIGCIPSKALLHASHLYAHMKELSDFGIDAKAKLNLSQMMKFKQEGIDANTKGVAFLLNKNKIDYIQANARLLGGGRVGLESVKSGGDVPSEIAASHIVIATGSVASAPPHMVIDEKNILSSTGALSLTKTPNHLAVIGGGYIGLEMGSVWARLGAKVSVIEMLPNILPNMDGEIARAALRIFQKQNISFHLGVKTDKIEDKSSKVRLHVSDKDGGNQEIIDADKVLIATGRKAAIDGLDLDKAGCLLDERGFIKIDDYYRAADGVYAIGDVIGGAMLAHKASAEGIVLAEMLANQKPAVNYRVIPGIVYTQPEIASVGLSQEEAQAQSIPYNIGKFPFTANGRAKVNHSAEGFVKIIAHKQTDRILGVHIISSEAGAMIAEAVVAMEYGASSEDIARIVHAHPTLSEAMGEAALAVSKRSLHM